jgi:hypothetical protein
MIQNCKDSSEGLDMTEQGQRTLSDADVQAIAAAIAAALATALAAALESRLTDRLVRGAGNGALAFLKKLLVWAIIGLFGYAVAHGWKP